MKEKLLCKGRYACVSCCTRGIEKISKKEMDRVLEEHAEKFKKHIPLRYLSINKQAAPSKRSATKGIFFKSRPDSIAIPLKNYVDSIAKNRMICEYLSKKGCLIHPSIIGSELRDKAPSNNFLRGKCRNVKTCGKEILMAELPKKVRERVQKELDSSKDYYEYSIKIKHLIPRIYVNHKAGEVNSLGKRYLNRILREPEAKNCFRLKSRLDFLIKMAKMLKL